MANEAEKGPTSDREGNEFRDFIDQKNAFGFAFSQAFIAYFEEDNRPETEFVKIKLQAFETTINSIGKELSLPFDDLDSETKGVINRHIRNTGSIQLFKSTTELLSKKSSILGFLEKIAPILEILKKIINQIIELLPAFLERILKKIILPLLEVIENIIKMVLELFGNKSASGFLKAAERDFLETHPLWRNMLFSTLAPESK